MDFRFDDTDSDDHEAELSRIFAEGLEPRKDVFFSLVTGRSSALFAPARFSLSDHDDETWQAKVLRDFPLGFEDDAFYNSETDGEWDFCDEYLDFRRLRQVLFVRDDVFPGILSDALFRLRRSSSIGRLACSRHRP